MTLIKDDTADHGVLGSVARATRRVRVEPARWVPRPKSRPLQSDSDFELNPRAS